MVEKRWLAVFVVICALGLAVGLDLFQLHVRSVCLCSSPTEQSPEGFQLKDFTFVQGRIDILKFDLVFHIEEAWSFVWGDKPTMAT